MKLYLSRQYNGMYMLTAIRPKLHRVGMSDHSDLYMRVGEPVGYRHMCPDSVRMLIPGFTHIKPLQTVQVDIETKLLERL
jgi:hypothetical protein